MKLLSSARKEKGLTQKELAQRLGVSPGLVGQIEAGHRRFYPRLKQLCALILKVDEKNLTEG